MTTKKLTTLSLLFATAMILSFVESRLPALTAIPGIRMGLANMAVMFTLYKLGAKEAVCVSLLRVLLSSLLFGQTVSLFYSLCGAALSLLVMILVKKTSHFSPVGVSVLGAVFHNVGQIGAAMLLLGSAVVYYLPILIVSGTVSGIFIGLCAGFCIKKVNIYLQ